MKIDRKKLLAAAHVELSREEEDSRFTDGHFQREDGSNDDEICDWIREELQMGNPWAWCVAHVVVSYKDFQGEDWLGGCSYKSEEDFRVGGYYESMVDEAVSRLAEQLEAVANDHAIWEHDETICLWCAAKPL